MSTAPATSDPALQPDPDRAVAGAGTVPGAGTAPAARVPTRIGRLLGLVRKLIDYGKELVTTLQQRASLSATELAYLKRPFGTADLALILARITCGLQRAAWLEARLEQRADRGQDMGSAPERPASSRPASPPEPHAAGQPAVPRTRRAEDPRLDCLPTAEQIAAEVRHRPVGAVIADICRDLGITPGNAGKFWRELSFAIIEYGGCIAGLFKDTVRRFRAFTAIEEQSRSAARAVLAAHAASSGFGCTGPPDTITA